MKLGQSFYWIKIFRLYIGGLTNKTEILVPKPAETEVTYSRKKSEMEQSLQWFWFDHVDLIKQISTQSRIFNWAYNLRLEEA